MDNLKKEVAVVLYFGFELFYPDNDTDEEEYSTTIINFSEELVPCMNAKQFKVHFRLEIDVFETLLQKLHLLHKERNLVSAGHPELSIDKACMIMIWYLANLESFRTVANRFGISKSTCWTVLYKMCNLLLEVNMRYKIISWPSNNRIEAVMSNFERRYGMPGIVGAIDGTHIRINAPKEHHVSYINRKNYHSILLQAVCDSKLSFLDVYTGQPGSMHDAAVFKKSDFYYRINTVYDVLKDIHAKMIKCEVLLSSHTDRLINIERKLNIVPQSEKQVTLQTRLPLQTIEELDMFEKRLQQCEDESTALVLLLKRVSGTNERSCIFKLYSKIFDNELATICSWKGRKQNYRVEHLKLVKIILDAARDSFPNIKDQTMEQASIDWFRFSQQRFARIQQKRQVNL